MTGKLERHSGTMDCRGTAEGKPIPHQNHVYITKTYVEDSDILVSTEVSCTYIDLAKRCTKDGTGCPHVWPIKHKLIE